MTGTDKMPDTHTHRDTIIAMSLIIGLLVVLGTLVAFPWRSLEHALLSSIAWGNVVLWGAYLWKDRRKKGILITLFLAVPGALNGAIAILSLASLDRLVERGEHPLERLAFMAAGAFVHFAVVTGQYITAGEE